MATGIPDSPRRDSRSFRKSSMLFSLVSVRKLLRTQKQREFGMNFAPEDTLDRSGLLAILMRFRGGIAVWSE